MFGRGRDPNERMRKDVERHLKQHANAIHQLQQNAGAQQGYGVQRQENDGWVENLASQQERYANVILLLGYGGFFALWTSAHERMAGFQFGLCGLLMAVSLLLFIGWELAKTMAVGLAINKATARNADGHRIHGDDEIRNIIQRRVDSINHKWLWVFIPTVLTGLAGGAMVLWLFISQLTA